MKTKPTLIKNIFDFAECQGYIVRPDGSWISQSVATMGEVTWHQSQKQLLFDKDITNTEADIKRKKVNRLLTRARELKSLSDNASLAREQLKKWEGPQFQLVICVEQIIKYMKNDTNRELEKLGMRRVR